MNKNTLNIIHSRGERLPLLMEEIDRQGIDDYEIWDGVYLPSIKASISAAHKQIVEYGKLAELSEMLIAEDDFIGTHQNSWKYFIQNKPEDYDLYLSQVYLGVLDENNCVKDFTGLTVYAIKNSFFDTFLNVDPNEHIDRALSGKGRFVVCNPFAFIQRNGWSSNTGKIEVYDSLLTGRSLYNG